MCAGVCGGIKGVVSQGCSVANDVRACMCGYGVDTARQSIAMSCMFQWVLVNGMGLSSLVGGLLGCTTLMRTNSPKEPSGCLPRLT